MSLGSNSFSSNRSGLNDINEVEVARSDRRGGDARVLSRSTATTAEGNSIEWWTIKSGRNQVTLRRSELEHLFRAGLERAASLPAPPKPVGSQQSFGVLTAKRIRSKFSGTCNACGKTYGVGDEILWAKGERPRHVACGGADAPQ